MKKKFRLVFLTWIFILSFIGNCIAQSGVLNSIGNAMKSGNSSEIARYMDNVVDITINNNQSSYSKSQAEMILRDFFSKNSPRSFEMEKSGDSGNNSAFGIGYLNTANGKYRVYILVKQKNNNYQVQEIRFEK